MHEKYSSKYNFKKISHFFYTIWKETHPSSEFETDFVS